MITPTGKPGNSWASRPTTVSTTADAVQRSLASVGAGDDGRIVVLSMHSDPIHQLYSLSNYCINPAVTDAQVAAYRIGEVARRAGMTTTALRAWERRYDVLSPARSAGGQRLYTDADVERVREVRRLVESGWTVAAAAERARADVGADIGDRAATEPPPAHLPPRATIIDA